MTEKLLLTPRLGRQIDDECEAQWFKAEVEVATQYWKLTTTLAANEMWSLLLYILTFPCMLSGLQSSDAVASARSGDTAKKLVTAIIKAEALVKEDRVLHSRLEDLLQTAAFTKEGFAREQMSVALREEFKPTSQELKDATFLMEGGSSTTADCLERCFATLAEVTRKYSNKRMEPFTKWFYASASPYTESGGMPSPSTTKSDYVATAKALSQTSFLQAFKVESPLDSCFHHMLFWFAGPGVVSVCLGFFLLRLISKALRSPLPENFPRPKDIIKKWKPAGHAANREMASASAFLIYDAPTEFANVKDAWKGYGVHRNLCHFDLRHSPLYFHAQS